MERPLGVVLAGGQSSRFGSDKALAKIPGDPRPLVSIALDIIRGLCDDLLVVRTASWPSRPTNVVQLPDPGRGPAVALATVWRSRPGRGMLVVPCDMPRLTPELLQTLWLASLGKDGACYVRDGRVEPVVVALRPSAADTFLRADDTRQADQSGVRGLLDTLDVARLESPAGTDPCFVNINRPDGLQAFGPTQEEPS